MRFLKKISRSSFKRALVFHWDNVIRQMQSAVQGMDEVKAGVKKAMGEEWADDRWTDFIQELCKFLLEKKIDTKSICKTAVVLIQNHYDSQEVLDLLDDFERNLKEMGISSGVAILLFDKYVGSLDAQARKAAKTVGKSGLFNKDNFQLFEMMALKYELPPDSPLKECVKAELPPKSLGGINFPDFLMHDLGSEKHKETHVFGFLKECSDLRVSALYGTSGAGKTRSILEFLSLNFGFFFITTVGSKNPGSSDFEKMRKAIFLKKVKRDQMETPEEEKGNNNVWKFTDEEIKTMSANRQRCSSELSVLLASRFLVFHLTKKLFHEKYGQEEKFKPIHWLYCQAHPKKIYGSDVFDEVYLKTREVFVNSIPILGQEILTAMVNHLGNDLHRMYCFLDEAQLLLNDYTEGYFASGDQEEFRSMYGAMVEAFARAAHNYGPYVYYATFSGTGLSESSIMEETTSPVVKFGRDGNYVFHKFDVLDERGVKAYLGKFINLERFDPDLLTHVARWLVGRPRWSASFLTIWMLREKPRDASSTVFYQTLRNGTYHDNVQLELELERYIELVAGGKVEENSRESPSVVPKSRASLSLDKASTAYAAIERLEGPEKSTKAAKIFLETAILYLATGKDVVLKRKEAGAMELVNVGICSVKTLAPDKMKKDGEDKAVSFGEPLIVEAAFNYLLLNDDLQEFLCKKMKMDTKNAAESFELISMIEAYRKLFKYVYDSSNAGMASVPEAFKNFAMPRTAYGVFFKRCINFDETLDYLETCIRTPFPSSVAPFCVPYQKFGPDGFFMARNIDDRSKSLVGIFQMKFSSISEEKDKLKVLRTLVPELCFCKIPRVGNGKFISEGYHEDFKTPCRWLFLASLMFSIDIPDDFGVHFPRSWSDIEKDSFKWEIVKTPSEEAIDSFWKQRKCPIIMIPTLLNVVDDPNTLRHIGDPMSTCQIPKNCEKNHDLYFGMNQNNGDYFYGNRSESLEEVRKMIDVKHSQ